MQISNVLAGYSLGDADILRRAMGKKSAEEMERQKVRFLEGAVNKGHNPKKAEKIFDLMAQFAGYGFNKSHSAAYAYMAYVTAYLKAHYPVEFMSALLTSETGNTAKVVKYINECRDMGIKVQPPDVNSSDFNFTPDGPSIRFGLGAIKNLGQGAVEAIIKARNDVSKFTSLFEFCDKVSLGALNKRAIESLIKAGAMDALDGNRAQQWAILDRAIEHGTRAQKDRESGQTGLFGDLFAAELQTPEKLPEVADWTSFEMLGGEKEMIGFYVTGHPLDQYMDKVLELRTHETDQLEGLVKGAEVAMCCILTGINRRRNKEGKLWASMLLEDHKGALEAMVFASSFESVMGGLFEDKAMLVRGVVMPEEGAASKISIKDVIALENARVNLPSMISIRVRVNGAGGEDETIAPKLAELFGRKPGGAEVRLRIDKSRDFSVLMDLHMKVRADKQFKAELERICGPDSLEVMSM